MGDIDGSGVRRAAAFAAVALLHLLVLAALASGGLRRPLSVSPVPARLIADVRKPPVPPPPLPVPTLLPPAAFVPQPEIVVAAPGARTAALQSVTHAPSAAMSAGRFGAATDSGLGLDVGTVAGGGTADRGSLAGFEAKVRRQVLAGKRQPALAWDRRHTCVVGYTVRIAAGGRLSGFSLDPCAVPEINDAARAAIQQAAYPPPTALGAAEYQVHGSLVFRP